MMRERLIAVLMLILPFFVNSQNFIPPKPKMQDIPFFKPWENNRPIVLQLEKVKPLNRSRLENAQTKVAIEERKLIKLARKAWDKEDELKKEKEHLINLEKTPENTRTPDHLKKIETAKKLIAKFEAELNEAKTKVDLRTKKLEDMEKAIEASKLKIQ
jgi:hypothetical protein